MSPAASALLRALVARAGVARDRILLIDVRSVDWQSLTFVGERHQFELRATGPNSSEIIDRLCSGLEDAEFSIPGQLVADINVVGSRDGSKNIIIEALTVGE